MTNVNCVCAKQYEFLHCFLKNFSVYCCNVFNPTLISLLFFCFAKRKVAKEKAIFCNRSAAKKKLYAVVAVRYLAWWCWFSGYLLLLFSFLPRQLLFTFLALSTTSTPEKGTITTSAF
jgi:hypothetical protein